MRSRNIFIIILLFMQSCPGPFTIRLGIFENEALVLSLSLSWINLQYGFPLNQSKCTKTYLIRQIDLSRIRFSDHETMVPSRGWTFHTFTVFYQVQPRLGTIVSWSLKVYWIDRFEKWSVNQSLNNPYLKRVT
jgi:hypothetical protein